MDFIAPTRQVSYCVIQIPHQQDELKMYYDVTTFSYEEPLNNVQLNHDKTFNTNPTKYCKLYYICTRIWTGDRTFIFRVRD